jgi:uncharacterized protein (DUF885 family)
MVRFTDIWPAAQIKRLGWRVLFLSMIVVITGCREAGPPAISPTATAGAFSAEATTAPAAASPTVSAAPTGEATLTAPAPSESAGPPLLDPQLAADYPQAAAIAQELQGLPFADFLDQSYARLLLRDPEAITELGLDAVYGTTGDRLTDISDGYIRETQALENFVLALLRGYDRDTLPAGQQLSYDIYEYYLDDLVRGHEFMYHDYPASFFITSEHVMLQQFFTELHPLAGRQDAEYYIARLGQVATKFEQLIAGLRIREELGVIPPRFVFDWMLPDIRQIAGSGPQDNLYFTNFAEALPAISDLDDPAQEQLLAEAEDAVATSVIPAYQALSDYLTELREQAEDSAGVWKLPGGERYYEFALRRHTTTELSADEIHDLGLRELERIHSEMRVVFDQLGYPADEGLPELYGRVAQDGGVLFGQEILEQYEALIVEAQANVSQAFDLTPEADVIVIGVPFGGYYLQPAFDGSRPGAFYATYTGSEAAFAMPTLAYHEAVPGHHFQLALMQEMSDLPDFRRGVTFTANVEGWALYAERLAKELGWYDDDPYGDLGRLQAEAFRAARLVVDTGIHDRRWTFEEAEDFMVENTGLPRQMVQGQIARYIVWPGQATSYMVGMLDFVDARQQVMEAQGEDFDLKAFHNLLLSSGSMPLAVLDSLVDDYIAAQSD